MLVTGSTVNGDDNLSEPGSPPGYDISTNFETWVILNFTHSSPGSTPDFTILESSNAIGLFENHQNVPKTDVIVSYSSSSITRNGLQDQPLPVELTSFTASIVDNKISLSWQTATEIDNYGFEIERTVGSTQAEESSSEPNWQKIGFVAGAGYSNSIKNYSFMDIKPLDGLLKYRLRQIDTDGKFEYSGIVEIVIEGDIPLEYKLSQNYPNPFNPSTNITFSLPEPGLYIINIYNSLGQRVAKLGENNYSAGTYSIKFDAQKLPSSIYIYQLLGENANITKKMLLLR